MSVIRQITDEIEGVDGVKLLDVDPGATTNTGNSPLDTCNWIRTNMARLAVSLRVWHKYISIVRGGGIACQQNVSSTRKSPTAVGSH